MIEFLIKSLVSRQLAYRVEIRETELLIVLPGPIMLATSTTGIHSLLAILDKTPRA